MSIKENITELSKYGFSSNKNQPMNESNFYIVPEFKHFAKIGSHYIGTIDNPILPGFPFSPLTSFFYYCPMEATEELVNGEPRRGKFEPIDYKQATYQDVPYNKEILVADVDDFGRNSGSKSVWNLEFYNQPFTLPNRSNPYIGNNAGHNFYNTKAKSIVSTNNTPSGELEIFAPPMSEADVRNIIDPTYVNEAQVPNFAVTNDWDTKEFFRSDRYYGTRIIEYIPMSFGDEKREVNGEIITIRKDKNIRLVPIGCNQNFRKPRGVTEQQLKDLINKRLFINPEFLKYVDVYEKSRITNFMPDMDREISDEVAEALRDPQLLKELLEKQRQKSNSETVKNDNELETLKEQYQEKFGTKPHHMWSKEKIQAKLAETTEIEGDTEGTEY